MVHAINKWSPRRKSWLRVEYFTALYGKVMNYKQPFSMEAKGEDVLSFKRATFLLYFTAR